MSSTFNRIVQMDALIRAGGYPSVADFKARFEVSARTVYHDIDYFKSTLRAPIVYSRSQGGYAYTDPTWPLPTIITTEGELLAWLRRVLLNNLADFTRLYRATDKRQVGREVTLPATGASG